MGVGGADGVLLDDEDSLAEKVGEDSDAIGLRDEHGSDLMEMEEIGMDALVVLFRSKTRKARLKSDRHGVRAKKGAYRRTVGNTLERLQEGQTDVTAY